MKASLDARWRRASRPGMVVLGGAPACAHMPATSGRVVPARMTAHQAGTGSALWWVERWVRRNDADTDSRLMIGAGAGRPASGCAGRNCERQTAGRVRPRRPSSRSILLERGRSASKPWQDSG